MDFDLPPADMIVRPEPAAEVIDGVPAEEIADMTPAEEAYESGEAPADETEVLSGEVI